ncbi:MAG: vitamin B12 dependent-methionine synthase activation domain-containing protein [Prevotella sp.]
MFEKILKYEELNISPNEIYEQMGYGSSVPDKNVQQETNEIIETIKTVLQPRLCFLISKGLLDVENDVLNIIGRNLSIGHIISRQLRHSEAYALFVATAGVEFEDLQQRTKADGDMVKVFITDAIGSVIAEKTADQMEKYLEECISPYNWYHTNRFSPGYCGWHVSQQQLLFTMFGMENPCGVHLTSSSLMIPIKSVSGIIGVGKHVKKLEYTCGLCDFKDCYKRKKKK